MTRPTWNDQMTKDLAQVMGKIIFEWCNDGTELDDCIKVSEKILPYHRRDDGYELAKELEWNGYTPDADLVRELDYVQFSVSDILKKYVEQWVQENNLKLDIEIDTEVVYEDFRNLHTRGKIVKLYPETLQYGVRKVGQPENQHTIVDSELVSKITTS